ncbi:MAG: NAD(P)/FAD-dependent oxidoreductase, partial [Cyanobacteria bacterium J06636_28]
DVDSYARMKVYGTPTTSEFYLGQPQGNIYGAKLIPKQVGLNRMGYTTELPNLFLVGATAGYPSVPGVITNGMNVVELITGRSVYARKVAAERSTTVVPGKKCHR